MIAVETLLSTHAMLSQCLLMSIVLGSLVIQLRNKPYAETQEEAKRWSSLNKNAAVSEACKLATIALGLLSTATNPGGSALGHAISAGIVVA
eukprot:COSAG06_NODE_27909_length_584_cov_0.907216_2_plen_91_part_01